MVSTKYMQAPGALRWGWWGASDRKYLYFRLGPGGRGHLAVKRRNCSGLMNLLKCIGRGTGSVGLEQALVGKKEGLDIARGRGWILLSKNHDNCSDCKRPRRGPLWGDGLTRLISKGLGHPGGPIIVFTVGKYRLVLRQKENQETSEPIGVLRRAQENPRFLIVKLRGNALKVFERGARPHGRRLGEIKLSKPFPYRKGGTQLREPKKKSRVLKWGPGKVVNGPRIQCVTLKGPMYKGGSVRNKIIKRYGELIDSDYGRNVGTRQKPSTDSQEFDQNPPTGKQSNLLKKACGEFKNPRHDIHSRGRASITLRGKRLLNKSPRWLCGQETGRVAISPGALRRQKESAIESSPELTPRKGGEFVLGHRNKCSPRTIISREKGEIIDSSAEKSGKVMGLPGLRGSERRTLKIEGSKAGRNPREDRFSDRNNAAATARVKGAGGSGSIICNPYSDTVGRAKLQERYNKFTEEPRKKGGRNEQGTLAVFNTTNKATLGAYRKGDNKTIWMNRCLGVICDRLRNVHGGPIGGPAGSLRLQH